MKRGYILKNKAQMKLSFGMIFSIFLIIIFIAFAIYAIKFLLNLEKTVGVGQFINNLQEDVDKMHRGSHGSQENKYYLDKDIEYVCFIDYHSPAKGIKSVLYNRLKQVFFEEENLFFYPIGSSEGIDSVKIKNINIEKITEIGNPFCVKNSEGKFNLIIKKEYGESSVEITK